MTNERREELKALIQTVFAFGLKEDDCYALEECIDRAYEADKYRWHDLRKDLKDLPDEQFSKSYLVMTDCGYAISKFYGYGEEAPGFREFPYGVWEANGYGMEVIAWKYIEEFER